MCVCVCVTLCVCVCVCSFVCVCVCTAAPSYKIWIRYLRERKGLIKVRSAARPTVAVLRSRMHVAGLRGQNASPANSARDAVYDAFQRALVFMHKVSLPPFAWWAPSVQVTDIVPALRCPFPSRSPDAAYLA